MASISVILRSKKQLLFWPMPIKQQSRKNSGYNVFLTKTKHDHFAWVHQSTFYQIIDMYNFWYIAVIWYIALALISWIVKCEWVPTKYVVRKLNPRLTIQGKVRRMLSQFLSVFFQILNCSKTCSSANEPWHQGFWNCFFLKVHE